MHEVGVKLNLLNAAKTVQNCSQLTVPVSLELLSPALGLTIWK